MRIIKFSITEKITRHEVDEATLNIHIQEPEHKHDITRDDDHITVDLQVSRVTKNSQDTRALVMYSEKSYKLTRKELRLGKWMKVNVTTLVAEFFSLPREHLEIVVKVQDSHRLNLMAPHQRSEYNNTMMPYIQIGLKDNTHTRTRRTIGMDCSEDIKEERCCRYPLIVSFEDFGWDWIIAPKEYAASYCSGTCPYSFLQKYPHTHLTHLARGGGPCCAPRKLSSISMLYFDEQLNIIFGTVPGMVVESCGCS